MKTSVLIEKKTRLVTGPYPCMCRECPNMTKRTCLQEFILKFKMEELKLSKGLIWIPKNGEKLK